MKTLYLIDEPENKTDMLPEVDEELICVSCGMPLQDSYLNPNYRAPQKCPDISHTYDGHYIVSEKFRETLQSASYQGLHFDALPASPGFYRMMVANVLEFTRPPELKFEKFCARCKRFVSVWGRLHVKVRLPPEAIAEGIYRSDIKMGHGRMMFYSFIATEEAKQTLQQAKIRGISFNPIEILKGSVLP